MKQPPSPPAIARTHSGRDIARRSTGGIFANLFARPPRTPTTPVHKETIMSVRARQLMEHVLTIIGSTVLSV
jgi:hypothetical protein